MDPLALAACVHPKRVQERLGHFPPLPCGGGASPRPLQREELAGRVSSASSQQRIVRSAIDDGYFQLVKMTPFVGLQVDTSALRSDQ